jgi:hypothetical protein
MTQTTDALTQHLAERWCWEMARRDDTRVARRPRNHQMPSCTIKMCLPIYTGDVWRLPPSARSLTNTSGVLLNFMPFGQEPRLFCKTPPPVKVSGVRAQRITSVAWKRRDGGIVRPSASAILRLMASSTPIPCSTGRSAGFAPFKILSTYAAARRPAYPLCGP